MVSNITLHYRESLLNDFKEQYGDENVINAYIVYDLEKLVTHINKFKELSKQLKKANQILDTDKIRPRSNTFFGLLKGKIDKIKLGYDTIDHLTNLINFHKEKIDQHKKIASLNATGYGFVTFSSIYAAKKCKINLI
jgi:hypothetical protein